MSLQLFLRTNRNEILELTEQRTLSLAALRPTSETLQKGLPIFFEQLVTVLSKKEVSVAAGDEAEIFHTASLHGKELLHLGYTLSHVVHAYGAMCQAITEVANIRKSNVTALEFHNLNRCLDIAIAGAVTEFDNLKNVEIKNREVTHLGVVAHELRNALNRAIVSYEMLSKGIVGLGGSTSKVLGSSLNEISLIIDRSLADLRLRVHSELHNEYFSINDLLSYLLVTAEAEANKREQTISLDVDDDLIVFTDRHLILSAIGNIVQNALKYSQAKSNIKITAKKVDSSAVISIEDQCGGFPIELMGEIFRPLEKRGVTNNGLGLGLLISSEAIEKCNGKLNISNKDKGCIFSVTLALAPASKTETKPKV